MSATRVTLTKLNLDVERIIQRMKQTIGAETDSALADFFSRAARRWGLDTKFRPQTITDWRKRNSISFMDMYLFQAECKHRRIKTSWEEIAPLITPPDKLNTDDD